MKNEAWFRLDIPQIEKKLKTSAATGLSRKAARSRVNREAGSLFLFSKRSPAIMLGEIFSDVAWILLLLTAILSLFFEDGFSNGLTVVLFAVGYLSVTGYLYYRSYRMEEAGERLFAPTVHVIRGGKLFCVDFRSVVVGDVMLVEAGDRICCDARIVNSDRLRVRMQVDRTRWMTLEKRADGFVAPQEHHASQMTTMLHAGSVVLEGSARAIVTAVGRYTYLGAMTGGIPLSMERKTPLLIQAMRKQCAKVNLCLLLAVLPFTLFSLLFNKIDGGHAWLSVSFLTAIAIAATTLSQLSCTFLRFFYTYRMRRLRHGSCAATVRSTEALERLAENDYIFMTDGCAMTDGRLHFHAAACAEGEIRNYASLSATATRLLELVSLYHTAASGNLTVGFGGSEECLAGLRELLKLGGVDSGSLRIRYPILSYIPASLPDAAEQIRFQDRGVRRCLRVSCSPVALAECGSVMLGGVSQPLSADGRRQLEQMWQTSASLYHAPLVFSLTDDLGTDAPCFVGMVSFREGIASHLCEQMRRLEQSGCRVISFVPGDANAPKIPEDWLRRGVVYRKDLADRKLPLTYHFGSFRTYVGFETEEILSLLDEVRKKGKKVLVVGFTEQSLPLAAHADGFVTCSPLQFAQGGLWDEELQTAEWMGRQYSASCTPAVKARAEYLIPRPTEGRGGIDSLTALMRSAKGLRRAASAWIRYWMQTQSMRVLITALPMFFGQTVLDARHILLFSFVMDAFALALFVCSEGVGGAETYAGEESPITCFLHDRPAWLASLAAVAVCLLTPHLLGWSGLSEQYLYPTEFCFSALLFLHMSAMLFCLCRADGNAWKQAFRRLPVIGAAGSIAVILLVCSLWQSVGNLVAWERLPFLYFALSLLPSAVFLLLAVQSEKRRR